MASDLLGRYYTDPGISQLLVSGLQMSYAASILDIGVGDGSLAKAAMQRYQSAHLISADIESPKRSIAACHPGRVTFHLVDGLSPNLEKKLKCFIGQLDVAVCNPPYKKIVMQPHHRTLLSSVGFTELSRKDRLTSDILFLAQNLRLLKTDGEIGIILPDTLLSGSVFMNFRKDILSSTTVMGVIQLPERIFSKITEASTHILLLKKRRTAIPYLVPIELADTNGKISNTLMVNSYELLHRMDYRYHKNTIANESYTEKLNQLNCIIFRGTYSKKELNRSLGAGNFFHLSDFRTRADSLNNLHFRNKPTVKRFAQAGDILLARVGKRVFGKVAFVATGKVEISDCVIAIRVPVKYRMALFHFLKSSIAQDYIQAHASGVCSRYITHSELLAMPVTLPQVLGKKNF